MRKTISLSILATTLLLAYNAQVKKSNITVAVNEQEKALKKGENIELNGGDIVCYKSGDGRLVIKGDGYKKQLSKKSSPCQKLPAADNKKSSVKAGELIASVFGEAKEASKSGVSRKGTDQETKKTTLTLKKNQKYILLENDTWGPMPIHLTILDSKNKKVKELEYNDNKDLKTSFLIPVSEVKNGYTLKVTNGFGDVLAIVTVKK